MDEYKLLLQKFLWIDGVFGIRCLCQQFFVVQEFGQCALSLHHLVQCGHHTGQFALSVVLFFQEISREVIDNLYKKMKKKIVDEKNKFQIVLWSR